MADVVLTTFNAKYIHAAFGLRYLLANLGDLRLRAQIVEFDLQPRALDIVEVLLAHQPAIIGIGVYVWNATLAAEVVAVLKALRPDILLVLGGPEVSFEFEAQPIVAQADYVIAGEADLAFAQLCRALLAGERPTPKLIHAEPPALEHLAWPYDLYTNDDVAHRLIYVEASRGCPYRCEFCLSSLEAPVRRFPLGPLLAQFQRLLDRGVRHFKFVDRTFNLHLETALAVLEFFLARQQPGLFLHCEVVPDRLPESLRQLLARFPAGALQFELGIQTFDDAVAARIQRRQHAALVEETFRFLRAHTAVHLHADLILGLPGESLASLAAGFDRLLALGPQEIQVGLLKRLRGAPIRRHDAEWGMVYNPRPPYDLLQNRQLDFATLQRLKRFARFWDLVGNSGHFPTAGPLLWADQASAFAAFLRWSDWLHAQVGRGHGIALARVAELLFVYLTQEMRLPPARVAQALWQDYRQGGRRDAPGFLRPHLPAETKTGERPRTRSTPRRQQRHTAPEERPVE